MGSQSGPDGIGAPEAVGSGAPEHDVEITPAMMEAGVRAYESRDSRFDRPCDVVEDIFMSMIEARMVCTR